MSKRKRGTGSKRAPSPRTAKAHRATQAIVRSEKDSALRSDAADATELPPELYDDSKQEAPLVSRQEVSLWRIRPQPHELYRSPSIMTPQNERPPLFQDKSSSC